MLVCMGVCTCAISVYMNSGCVLEYRDTSTSHCVTYTYGNDLISISIPTDLALLYKLAVLKIPIHTYKNVTIIIKSLLKGPAA